MIIDTTNNFVAKVGLKYFNAIFTISGILTIEWKKSTFLLVPMALMAYISYVSYDSFGTNWIQSHGKEMLRRQRISIYVRERKLANPSKA